MSKRRPFSPLTQLGDQSMEQILSQSGYFADLLQITLGSRKWDNLPYGLNNFRMNWYLLTHGMCAAFNDPQGGFMILPCSGRGRYNIYNWPTEFTAYGFGRTFDLMADECVIIPNNAIYRPDIDILEDYANRMNEIAMTDKTNVAQLRVPWLFGAANEGQANSLKAAVTDTLNNSLAIFISDELLTNLKDGFAFNTGTKYLGDDLNNHIHDIRNDYLCRMGIDNVPVRKKERVNTEEVESNNQLILYNRRMRTEPLEDACAEILSKFGYDLSVKWDGGESENVQTVSPVDGE